jgi:hypothetical protein
MAVLEWHSDGEEWRFLAWRDACVEPQLGERLLTRQWRAADRDV